MTAKTKSFISWSLIILGIFCLLGCILYPGWWYSFVCEGGIFNILFWTRGLRGIFRFFLENPMLILAIIVILILQSSNKVSIKLPLLDIFNSKLKIFLTIFFSVVIGLAIWFIPSKAEKDYQNLIEQTESKVNPPKNETVPLDFIYINTERINTLFEQIKPTLTLKEKTLRNKEGVGKEISNGENPILNSKKSSDKESEQTDTYVPSDISEPQKVTALLNHFTKNNLLKEYQSLQVSSEDVKQLDSFKVIAKQFNITYNEAKFTDVYNRVIGETLVKEHASIKNLTGVVLIKGDFIIKLDSNKINLQHDYFFLDPNNRISFNINSLSKTEKISGSLKDESQNNKTINLTVLGKVIRVESNEKISQAYIDVYSIW